MSDNIPGLHVPGTRAPESRFIAADERCPHPERWHSTDGDSTEAEVSELIGGLVRALQPDVVVETGAAFGQTTTVIAKALRGNEHGHVYSLETDPARVEYARDALLFYDPYEHAEIVEASSLEWEPPAPIDLLFSDSNYETRVPEFLHFRPWLRAGSIVVFHDTAPERGAHRIPSGNDLRSEIEAQLGAILSFVHLPTPRGVTIAGVR